MDLLTVILIAVAAFVVFVLLTAYFMKATLYMNTEVSKAKADSEKANSADSGKKDNGK